METKEIPTQFNQEVRDRHDTNTWLAEVLDGRMVTEFSYNYDHVTNELYAEDGSALEEIFETAIDQAKVTAGTNPDLAFELRRREVEKTEYEDMLGMMQGGSNTMVAVSDFPEELMDATEDVGGYNTSRKQTMLRIITRQEDSTLKIQSLSLDGSNRTALEKVYEHFGLKAEPGELLGQRIYQDLDPYQQEFLSDQLTGVYDRSMSEQNGGTWKAGRQQPDNPVNTYDFVLAQNDLIDYYLHRKYEVQIDPESLQFAIAAEMERRWEASDAGQLTYRRTDTRNLEAQILVSALTAQSRGKTYSGCGVSLGGINDQMKALGYGNEADQESMPSDKYGPLDFNCPKGHKNTRPRNQLIECCKKCGVSVKC